MSVRVSPSKDPFVRELDFILDAYVASPEKELTLDAIALKRAVVATLRNYGWVRRRSP